MFPVTYFHRSATLCALRRLPSSAILASLALAGCHAQEPRIPSLALAKPSAAIPGSPEDPAEDRASPPAAPRQPARDPAPGSLAPSINAATLRILPSEGGRPVFKPNSVFEKYVKPPPKLIKWSQGWTRKIDLSGVAWDMRQTVTMISPRHGVMAAHFKRKKGTPVIFHDRQGRKVTRRVAGRRKIDGVDLTITLLDKDLPATVRHYRVLPPAENYHARLPGAYALITNQFRKVHVHEVRLVRDDLRIIAFQRAAALPAGYYKDLVKGDSGNSSFLWLRNEPLLIETHTAGGGGAGPFLSHPKTFRAINAAMKEMSESAGAPVYQLKTLKP